MEICQSCSGDIEGMLVPERVSFGIIGGVTRAWVMCTHCTDVLGEMVLGYMGELPPDDEEQSCETCRGYSPLLFGCTKRTQSGSESCRSHGFAWWEPKEPEPNDTEEPEPTAQQLLKWLENESGYSASTGFGTAVGLGSCPSWILLKHRIDELERKQPEPDGTGWAGDEDVVYGGTFLDEVGEPYTTWFKASQEEESEVESPHYAKVRLGPELGSINWGTVHGHRLLVMVVGDENTEKGESFGTYGEVISTAGEEELPFAEEPCPEPPDCSPPPLPKPLGPPVWIGTSTTGTRYYTLDEGKNWAKMLTAAELDAKYGSNDEEPEEPEWLPCIRKITQGAKDCDDCEIGEHPAFSCYQMSGSVPVGEVP